MKKTKMLDVMKKTKIDIKEWIKNNVEYIEIDGKRFYNKNLVKNGNTTNSR